jgi:C_GCAxxG_C_C family probable redox protein
MNEREAIEQARAYFLTDDNLYGCSETMLIVLQEAYGLSNPTDSSPAMALNGGVAWSGGPCGAVTGAAMAVGRLAAQRIADHKDAKRAARCIISRLMADFYAQYGHVNCRELIGLDISTEAGHTAFIEGKLWHTICMGQIEFVLHKLVALRDERVWMETLHQIENSE